MPRYLLPCTAIALAAVASPVQPLMAVDRQDTRMVASPAESAIQTAFLYAGDLWTCAPDIEVEQLPKDVIAGRDPQLEKAIELMKAELKKTPPQKLVRPPYPVRTR